MARDVLHRHGDRLGRRHGGTEPGMVSDRRATRRDDDFLISRVKVLPRFASIAASCA